MGTSAPVDIIWILTQPCNQRALPTMSSESTNVGLFGRKSYITTIISDGAICPEGMCLKKDFLACQWKWARAWLMDLVLKTQHTKKLHSILLKGVFEKTVLRKKLWWLLPWGGAKYRLSYLGIIQMHFPSLKKMFFYIVWQWLMD